MQLPVQTTPEVTLHTGGNAIFNKALSHPYVVVQSYVWIIWNVEFAKTWQETTVG
jgi:hypothetical protein